MKRNTLGDIRTILLLLLLLSSSSSTSRGCCAFKFYSYVFCFTCTIFIIIILLLLLLLSSSSSSSRGCCAFKFYSYVFCFTCTVLLLLFYYYYLFSWNRPFLPGTCLEPTVIPTDHVSTFRLQYFPYYV